jgi:hypothetical protein
VADGWVLPSKVIDDTGQYHFPVGFTATNIQAGINYTSSLTTVRPEPKSTVQGLIKRWVKIWARLYQTVYLNINQQNVPFRPSPILVGEPVPPTTGDVEINNLKFDRDGRITVIQAFPLYTDVLSVFGAFEVSDGI